VARIERAIRNAEAMSGLTYSVYLGPAQQSPRAHATRLHSALEDPDRTVLVLCDPGSRVLEIVTGREARRTLNDMECGLAAASMQSSFAAGDLVGGLAHGVQQLGEAARAPRTLHTSL
jgi:hypothetical protein